MSRADGSWFIGAAVLLFGLAVATGTAVRYHDVGRGLIVVLCSVVFLGGWAAIQAKRHQRLAAPSTPRFHRRVITDGWGCAVVSWPGCLLSWGFVFRPPRREGPCCHWAPVPVVACSVS